MQARKHNPISAVLVEDNEALNMIYEQYLSRMGFTVRCFNEGHPALDEILSQPPDLLLLDLELPDRHGLEILRDIREKGVSCPCIAMTAHGALNPAADAMKFGADDFLEKPFAAERLQVTVDNLLDRVRLQGKVQALEDDSRRSEFAGFVGGSLAMQAVYRTIQSAAASRASVFITGESGTGKELCASAIHNQSDRANGPFIAINCGAIPRDLFESEMFGHVKGAFSGAHQDRVGAFEAAHGGTLFLDELGEMDPDQQVKLLRVIQSGQVQRVGSQRSRTADVRIVCATNRDPWKQVQDGCFREDLYYRLNVIPIQLPPLRERGDDVLMLARYFLQNLSQTESKPCPELQPSAETWLLEQAWPGNVRELHNRIHQLLLLGGTQSIDAESLAALAPSSPSASSTSPHNSRDGATLPNSATSQPCQSSQRSAAEQSPPPRHAASDIEPLWLSEMRCIKKAIAACKGNIPVAAAHLGISASTIYRKIKSWDSMAREPA
nr:sigma-54-dependent Fis family transcriptional regulator [Oceanococcus sp. HetDA_MAG_MS8]